MNFKTFIEADMPPAAGGGRIASPGALPGGGGAPPMGGGMPPPPPMGGGMGGGMGGMPPDPMGGGMGGGAAPGGMQPTMQIKFSDVWSVFDKILNGKPLEGEKDENKSGQAPPDMLQQGQPNLTNQQPPQQPPTSLPPGQAPQ